jgi:hypothetical protein
VPDTAPVPVFDFSTDTALHSRGLRASTSASVHAISSLSSWATNCCAASTSPLTAEAAAAAQPKPVGAALSLCWWWKLEGGSILWVAGTELLTGVWVGGAARGEWRCRRGGGGPGGVGDCGSGCGCGCGCDCCCGGGSSWGGSCCCANCGARARYTSSSCFRRLLGEPKGMLSGTGSLGGGDAACRGNIARRAAYSAHRCTGAAAGRFSGVRDHSSANDRSRSMSASRRSMSIHGTAVGCRDTRVGGAARQHRQRAGASDFEWPRLTSGGASGSTVTGSVRLNGSAGG